MYENWISIIWRRSIPVNSRTWAQSLFVISKPTCDKPKAEGRRPESASEASSIRPEVYSSRSEHLPEAPTCIRPRVHWPEVYSSIREVNWVYVKSRKVEENSRKSPERVQKKSRKSPEKVHRKIRIIPECVSEKSRENAEEVQKKFPENQFLKKSIIYSIHLKGKVNDYLMMRQYSCGILPTFLSLEAHQGKIISYVTAIWKPQWDFQITVTAKKCFAFHSLYNFKRSPLNLIIITHLCYKTMLRVNQGSSWGKEQSTCTIVELCVKVLPDFRIVK